MSFVSLVSERFSQPHSYGSIDSQHCFKFCQGLILAHSLQWDMIFLWFLRRDPCVYRELHIMDRYIRICM